LLERAGLADAPGERVADYAKGMAMRFKADRFP
jgi:hypothetical protein